MPEKKKRISRVDKLAFLEGFSCLYKASKLAKNLERKHKTKIFAVGVVMVATNGEYVFNLTWQKDKQLLIDFMNNGKPIRHPEIHEMARGIAAHLEKEHGVKFVLKETGEK